MTEAEHVFYSDIKEKKRTGYGAKNKKNGSRSKKCSLPSDYLTRKEKQSLNGEVITWDMKKFYSYDEFKKMPSDIRIRYINSMMTRYDIGISTISSHVFQLSSSALHMALTRAGEIKYINHFSGKPKEANIKRLLDDIEKSKQIIGKVTSVEETDSGLYVEADVEPSFAEKVRNAFKPIADMIPDLEPEEEFHTNVSDFLIRIDNFDDHIWGMLKDLFDSSDNIEITISVVPKGS